MDTEAIRAANETVIGILQNARIQLTGVGTAGVEIPFLQGRKALLHSGPPVAWENMCSAMKNAACGAIVYEGWADTLENARIMSEHGEIVFGSANDHHAVGPMAGIISPSMPVWKFLNTTYGNRSCVTFNEGLGRTLRFGANGPDVLKRLKWIETVLGPVTGKALALSGPIDLTAMLSRGIQRGDEAHNRNKACTGLFIRTIAPWLVRTDARREDIAQILEFFDGNDHTFLNLSMGLCKATMEPAYGIRNSTVVTSMCTNGYEFGIHVAGLGETWITAPAVLAKGHYFKGYGDRDASPTLGDSYVSEANGLGGFAMAAAPGIGQFIGITVEEGIQLSLDMYKITLAEHELFRIPALGFRGSPLGIDIRKVLETGILPSINTGIAHKEPEVGQIGAGTVRPPMAVFEKAWSMMQDG